MRQLTTVRAMSLLVVLASGCSDRAESPSVGTRAPTPAQLDSTTSAGAQAIDSTAPLPSIVPWTPTAVDSPLTLTLAQIGHRSGITLLGALDASILAIPVNPGLRPSSLALDVMVTPGMPRATIMLSQRDRVLAMQPLTDTTTRVTFSLANAIVDQGRATVTVGITVPGRDACEAQAYYRTVLVPSSRIDYAGAPAPTTVVNAFFAPWVERVTFYLPDAPSLDAAQAALDAAAFVARRYRGMATEFAIRPLPADAAALPEPGPWERAIVWNAAGATAIVGSGTSQGTVLAVGTRRDARQLFTFQGGADLVAASGFRAGAIDLNPRSGGDATVRTLADLGFDDRTVEGNTLVIADYPFALADFGGSAGPTAFRLVANHSIIPTVGNGSVRVHLNGALVWSKTLNRAAIDEVIDLPSHLLRRDNSLQVRFQVVLGEGACILGSQVFTATVDASSAFVLDNTDRVAPGFARFPSAFVPTFSVLLDPLDRYRVELAARVIGAMQQTTRTPLAPALARDRAAAVGPLLAIGTASLADALEAPVHAAGFRLRDRAGRIWDEFTPGTPYAAMQGWERDGDNILLLHHTEANGLPLSQLLDESFAPYGWYGVRGDLIVRGTTGEARSLTVTNAGWRIEERPASPGSFFARYRKYIFGTAALLLVIFAWWSYPRLVRRELDTTG